MLHRVFGTLRASNGETRTTSWLVDAHPPVVPTTCADVVLAHLHAEAEARQWRWAEPPVIEELEPQRLAPGQWFIPEAYPGDCLAFLAPPLGGDEAGALNLLVGERALRGALLAWRAPTTAEANVEAPRRWQVVLDMIGPLHHPVPAPATSRSACVRGALVQLLAQHGDWIGQIGQLLNTVSLDPPSTDDTAHELAVLDHLDRVIAMWRETIEQHLTKHTPS